MELDKGPKDASPSPKASTARLRAVLGNLGVGSSKLSLSSEEGKTAYEMDAAETNPIPGPGHSHTGLTQSHTHRLSWPQPPALLSKAYRE